LVNDAAVCSWLAVLHSPSDSDNLDYCNTATEQQMLDSVMAEGCHCSQQCSDLNSTNAAGSLDTAAHCLQPAYTNNHKFTHQTAMLPQHTSQTTVHLLTKHNL